MADTRILCPEWTRIQENEINIKKNSCEDMKPNTARCSLRGGRHRAVRFLLFFFFVAAVGLLSFDLLTSYNNKENDEKDTLSPVKHRAKRQSGTCNVDMCLTQECIHAASSIMNSMDTSVDPCEDFFQYTCGNWIKENSHKTGLDDLFYAINHNTLPEKTDLTLSQLLRQNIPIPEEVMDTKPYQNLFTFQESCMFVGQMPEGDFTEALDLLKSLQEFQIGRPFDPTSWDLTKAILELLKINGAPLIDVIIQTDVRIPEKYAINITPPRRYGLIPALIGPRLRNPGVEEYFRLKSRQALFGDLSDDLIMQELLSALDKGDPTSRKSVHRGSGSFGGRGPINKKRSGVVSGLVGKPSLNVLPTDDILEKTAGRTTFPPMTTPRTTTTTSSGTPTTTEPPATTLFAREQTTTKPIHSTSVPHTTTTAEASTSSSSTPLPLPSSSSPTTTFFPPTSWDMHPDVTELGPYFNESTDIPNYEEEDEDYKENARKIVSRKAVFKIFMRNLEMKRTESIGAMVQNSFSNISEEDWASSFGDFQQEDIFSAVIDHFVPLLDEIQPSEQEELRAQQHAALFNHFTLSELQELTPVIDWRYLLSEIFGKNITDEDNIYVYHPAYMTQLNHLLTALDPWVIHYGMVALYAYDILREVTVVPPEMDREDFCLQATKNVFGDVMSHMYLNYVGNKTINDIRKHTATILENLKEEVRISTMEATWLNPSDREEALKKLNGLQAEVGALDRHWDIDYVNESHAGISLSTDSSFLHNVMVVYRVFREELYKFYHEPVDRDMLIWSFTVQPFVVNAFHMQTANTIVFPEAFFQKPYYSAKAPEYINYGSAGSSMAHEIFHGIDFTGTLFDHLGGMSRPFSNDTRFHLRETVECYHKLLSDTFYEEVPVETTLIAMEIDSTTTLNENLADIGGIRHAFRAYQRWEENNYREPRLPAINLSPYQLFFVAAVRPYCAIIPNLAKIFLMEMDEHLPNGMRMNAMMMNTPEFAQVFNCTPGSRMVASQTCPIFR